MLTTICRAGPEEQLLPEDPVSSHTSVYRKYVETRIPTYPRRRRGVSRGTLGKTDVHEPRESDLGKKLFQLPSF